MYDSKLPTKDEKQIKDFMVAKYEKKMYYCDPVSQNGMQSKPTVTAITTNYHVNIKYLNNLNGLKYVFRIELLLINI